MNYVVARETQGPKYVACIRRLEGLFGIILPPCPSGEQYNIKQTILRLRALVLGDISQIDAYNCVCMLAKPFPNGMENAQVSWQRPGQRQPYLAAGATGIVSFFSKGSASLLQLSHRGRRYQLLSAEFTFLTCPPRVALLPHPLRPHGGLPL